MPGERLGRRLVRLDAIYCAGAGLLLIALALPLGRLFEVPVVVPVGLGLATTLWAVVLLRLARRPDWRGWAATLAAVALEVAAIGLGQGAAARRN